MADNADNFGALGQYHQQHLLPLIPRVPPIAVGYRWALANDAIIGGGPYSPTIVTVDSDVRNYHGNVVENNIGRLILASYSVAFRLARRRFNFRSAADLQASGQQDGLDGWLQTHATATPMLWIADQIQDDARKYYGADAGGGLVEVPNMHVRGGQTKIFSMVRVTISNMPCADEAEPLIVFEQDVSSNNVYLKPNDNMLTIRKMYTSLMKRFYAQPGGAQIGGGSGQRVIFPDVPAARRNSLRISFQFMFIKGPNWQPLQNPDDYVQVFPPIPAAHQYAGAAGGGLAGHRAQRNIQAVNYNETALARASGRQFMQPPNAIQQAANNRRMALRAHGMVTRSLAGSTRLGRAGGDNTSILYSKLKDRIYIRRNLGDYFVYSKACIATPITEEELCIPMAFMRCQLRTWTRMGSGVSLGSKMESVQEDEAFEIPVEISEEYPLPTLNQASFFNGSVIKVFDNMKQPLKRVGSHGRLMYKNEMEDLEKWEIDLWKWCAYQVHMYVEEVCEEKIDLQDLDTCLAAYSFVFQVNISVFAIEMKGERISLQALPGCRKKESFVGLLLQNAHVHAVSHMRHYHRAQIATTVGCLHSYCDYCATLCYSRGKDFGHVNKCASNENWRCIQTLEKLHEHEASKMEFRKKIQYLKGEDRNQEVCLKCYKAADTDCSCPQFPPTERRMTPFGQCTTCCANVPLYYFNEHRCYMKSRKPKERLENEKIFVYDIESMQTYNAEVDQYIHDCILVCLRAVYDDRKWKFYTIGEFVRFLIETKEMHGSVILAHNGGGYDHQFVVRYLEDSNIMHSTVPRPSTLHKYLMLEITMAGEKTAIKFLDFLMMMTDSLKNIGKAFKLPSCKGDFPHRFSRQENLNYVGPLPNMKDPEDWFSLQNMKTQADLEETKEYWISQEKIYCTCYNQACNCSKPAWNFKEQLETYCWLDVEVLAGACRAYRDQALNFQGSSEYSWSTTGIEPFQYMTQSQIALALFLEGGEQNKIVVTHEKIRDSFRPQQLLWMEHLMLENPEYQIQHAGNSFLEYYHVGTSTYLDGFCRNTKTAFEYYDCMLDGCPRCYQREINAGGIHPYRGVRWDKVAQETSTRLINLKTDNFIKHVVVKWSHDNELYPEFSEVKSMGNLMHLRDFFYGGRTEVFAAFADSSKFPNMEILHHDVCSLYPYVCSWKELPLGEPEVYFNNSVDRTRLNPNHRDPYFGFARIKVRPNTKDLIGILPQRTAGEDGEDKLTYDLLVKEGCWHTELIYLAMEHQYTILEVYEVWHWPVAQRSSTLMRGYMEFFLRMKQEAEGWSKLGKDMFKDIDEETLTETIKDDIAEMIFKNNGGFARPRKDKVEKNPVLRQLAKIFLNCLWGKLCQKNPSEHERFIYGYKQYLEIGCNALVDPATLRFRQVNGSVFKVRYRLIDSLQEKSRFVNIPIAASVTAHAQTILMRQMFKIGPERILYCDTDSIMFFREKGWELLNKSGLGNWENEHPNEIITRFWALAPKCYMMEIEEKSELNYSFKCKGVRETVENKKKTSFDNIHHLVESEFLGRTGAFIMADTMTIHPNSTNALIPYGTLCTCYGEKKIRIVFSKRQLLVNKNEAVSQLSDVGIVRLVPFGYNGFVTNTL